MSSIGGISFTGLASGLDTRAILGALLDAERIPMLRLEARRGEFVAKRDAWNRMDSLLGSLHDAVDQLQSGGAFDALAVSTSRDDAVRASLSSGATAGTWSVLVDRLATAQSSASEGQDDRDVTTYSGAEVDFIVPSGTVSIDFSGQTLDQIAATINAHDDLDLTATVVDDGSGSKPFKLVLTSNQTGTANAFSVNLVNNGAGGGTVADLFDEIESGPVTSAEDSRVFVNGIAAERSSNSIDDLITGVTLDLLQVDATATTVTVADDPEAAVAAMQSFAEAWNALRTAVDSQAGFDQDSGARGVLFGDPTLRGILGDLRTALSGSVTAASGSTQYSLAAFVGVEVGRDGQIEFDEAEFRAALADDPAAVQDLLANAGGLAEALDDTLDRHLESVTGSLAVRVDGLDDRIDDIDDSIDRTERRIGVLQSQLEARFAALETLLSRLQQQSLSLTGFTA